MKNSFSLTLGSPRAPIRIPRLRSHSANTYYKTSKDCDFQKTISVLFSSTQHCRELIYL